MTYGQSTRLCDENAAEQRSAGGMSATLGGFQVWRRLDADSRLALIEDALCPANDFIDDFPIAL